MSASTSRSRSDSGAPGCSARGANTVMPLPTMRTAIATSSADQSLDTKPEAPAALAAWGEIQPAPEISSTRVRGRLAADRLAQLGAGLLAEEQVHQRHVGLVAACQLRAPPRRRGP